MNEKKNIISEIIIRKNPKRNPCRTFRVCIPRKLSVKTFIHQLVITKIFV